LGAGQPRNDLFEIVHALVLVSTRETDDHKARCLLEEMTQALGLPNDSDELPFSSDLCCCEDYLGSLIWGGLRANIAKRTLLLVG